MHPSNPLLALAFCFTLATMAAEPAGPPGVVIHHSPAATKAYLGSPSLAVLPNGDYVASHDFFGPGTTNDRTAVYGSPDRGQTWRRLTEIQGQWWSSLFVHRGALYLLGTSRQDGFCVIRRSTDGGSTWTEPKDRYTGLLLDDAKYHCAPVPVVEHNGRLWRGMEDVMGFGGWGTAFRSFMMSVPVGADLLDAQSWTFSNRLGRQPQWLDAQFGGWLEGNAVVSAQGRIVNLLRVDYRRGPEKMAMVNVSPDGKNVWFDPETGFIDFPGGCKKFLIRQDPRDGVYWALSNLVPERHRGRNPERIRNTLALLRSTDLRHWETRCALLYYPETEKTGFQYPDWLFDGDDMIAVVRTAFADGAGGAHNQHDANYITFLRVKNFRAMGPLDSAPGFPATADEP
jgi:hypothetical protein